MKRLEKKHPLAIRWFHWINFPVLAVMIWSGLLIYWANAVYRIGIGSATLFKFFPQWLYTTFHLEYRLAEGMAWHFFFMWLFAINGVVYVLYTAISGEWRSLLPTRRSFREAIQVTLSDLHLSKVHPPRRQFNGAQQIAYTSIIVMGAGSLLTGLAIYKPVQCTWRLSPTFPRTMAGEPRPNGDVGLSDEFDPTAWQLRVEGLAGSNDPIRLALEHGAPLRLVIPVKYGIKNIKRIGTIRFTNQRPADYWAARGYDWYAGH